MDEADVAAVIIAAIGGRLNSKMNKLKGWVRMPSHSRVFGALVVGVCATVAAISATTSKVAADARMAAGTLTCRGTGTVGLILGSTQRLDCEFQRIKNGPRSNYDARITKVGLSLGVTGRNVMIWTVLASTDNLPGSALAGRYAGVGANASVGVGVGANALIGGSSNSVVLQPLSVQAQTGVNIAAGVAGLTLTLRN